MNLKATVRRVISDAMPYLKAVKEAYGEARVELGAGAADILPDTCRLIVGEDEYEDVPCRFKGGAGNVDGAPYRIEFAWDSPAVTGADVVVDAITGRPQMTLKLVEPVDSSTGLWQEWKATSSPYAGRVDVGL